MIDITQYKNGDAIDLLANIMEHAMDIIGDKKFVAKWKSGKPVMYAIVYAMKEHRDALVNLVCAIHGETPDTYQFDAVGLIRDVQEIIDSPLFNEVFSSQNQMTESAPSGSATENTEETGIA